MDYSDFILIFGLVALWGILHEINKYINKKSKINEEEKNKYEERQRKLYEKRQADLYLEKIERLKSRLLNIRNSGADNKKDLAIETFKQLLEKGESNIDLSRFDFTGVSINDLKAPGTNFFGCILKNAYFFNCDLSGSLFMYSNFNSAQLISSNFYKADFFSADLREADLKRSIFNNSNLAYADLKGADLIDTSLQWANLQSANLSNSYMIRTKLFGADLSYSDLRSAKGLKLDELRKAKTLYYAKIDSYLRDELEKKYPDIFEKIDEN